MKFKTLMIIKAVVCLALGLPILFIPKLFYSIFGVTLAAGGIFAAREYGASLIGNFLLTWIGRDSHESIARRGIIWALCVYDAIGFVATLVFALSGEANLLIWLPVVLYLFLAIAYGYFLVKPPKP
ncbi:MAG: hypothetical protein V2J07_06130 [Anaerolineae bacterium]|jgi:hypothetical protein|nr:hypothetical protein [Anaerolineae bacterium]